jgi:transposase
VESFFSWLKRFRKIAPRYEKTLLSFWGLLTFAAALIVFNKG